MTQLKLSLHCINTFSSLVTTSTLVIVLEQSTLVVVLEQSTLVVVLEQSTLVIVLKQKKNVELDARKGLAASNAMKFSMKRLRVSSPFATSFYGCH